VECFVAVSRNLNSLLDVADSASFVSFGAEAVAVVEDTWIVVLQNPMV